MPIHRMIIRQQAMAYRLPYFPAVIRVCVVFVRELRSIAIFMSRP